LEEVFGFCLEGSELVVGWRLSVGQQIPVGLFFNGGEVGLGFVVGSLFSRDRRYKGGGRFEVGEVFFRRMWTIVLWGDGGRWRKEGSLTVPLLPGATMTLPPVEESIEEV
jgi:hypothetical protein